MHLHTYKNAIDMGKYLGSDYVGYIGYVHIKLQIFSHEINITTSDYFIITIFKNILKSLRYFIYTHIHKVYIISYNTFDLWSKMIGKREKETFKNPFLLIYQPKKKMK